MTIYEIVKDILTKYPATRDSDKKLIWSVWIKQGKVVGGKITMDNYLNSEIEESITRARRMVQNDFPELRATPLIQEMRQKKEEEKGTFVYRDELKADNPIDIDYETRMRMLMKAKEELIKKGILHKR